MRFFSAKIPILPFLKSLPLSSKILGINTKQALAIANFDTSWTSPVYLGCVKSRISFQQAYKNSCFQLISNFESIII